MLIALHLEGPERVFEAGTGTGYQTAIMARLSSHVYTVERDYQRIQEAKARLERLGITNVTFIHGDAAYGLPQHAPFDRLIFGCAIHGYVDQHLIDQMAAPRSRLIAPGGTFDHKEGMIIGDLLICDKRGEEVTQKVTTAFRGTLSFVPLLSSRSIGWTARPDGYFPSSQLSKRRIFPWQKRGRSHEIY
jgi:protein-L-isoaspartate(D-aspartate) O-methyltransferase